MGRHISIDENELVRLVDLGLSYKEIAEKMNLKQSKVAREMFKRKIKSKHKPYFSEEAKKTISLKRKQWLRENPDKHPWRNKDKFKSKPCENVVAFLIKNNISFITEYLPNIPNRNFSVDIALPDKMIAIEINGNQHYEKTGELKPYYKERHDLLISNGWTVFEIHYSACFCFEQWNNFIDTLNNTTIKHEFDYFAYTPSIITITTCSKCGTEITAKADKCRKCNSLYFPTKIIWPNDDELQRLLWEKPMNVIGTELGVSGGTIAKRVRAHKLNKPSHGFWFKK